MFCSGNLELLDACRCAKFHFVISTPTEILSQIKPTPIRQWDSLMTVASVRRAVHTSKLRNLLINGSRNITKSPRLVFKFPQISVHPWHPWWKRSAASSQDSDTQGSHSISNHFFSYFNKPIIRYFLYICPKLQTLIYFDGKSDQWKLGFYL